MIHETTLVDARGEEHRYSTTPIPFPDGFDLHQELLAAIVEPLTSLLEGASSADITALGAAAKQLPQEILARGGSQLVKRLLCKTRRTYRHGQAEDIEFLSTDEAISRAYAGNWPELYEAAIWVADCNFGPFGASSGWARIWQKLSAGFTGSEAGE